MEGTAHTPVPGFKAGFAALIGRTNVGKSTLLNALVGRKIAIVTPRPQTTRDIYHGIVNRPGGQIVLVDSPGIYQTTPNKLMQNLNNRARAALEGIDVVVHAVDPSRPPGNEDRMAANLVRSAALPRILCMTKLDLRKRPFREVWTDKKGLYRSVVEVSALENRNLEDLVQSILDILPEGPPLYPDGQFSNMTDEFWMAEIIREKVFLLTGQEVPYTASVQVESVQTRADREGNPMVAVKAALLTTDDRHQRMLIGRGARKIREIGTAARKDMEAGLGRKVFLDLAVLVDPKWIERLRLPPR